MVLFPSFLEGLARTRSLKKMKNCHEDVARKTAEALEKEAKKNELVLSSSSGIFMSDKSNNFSSVCSKRGQKGINQDCLFIWEVSPQFENVFLFVANMLVSKHMLYIFHIFISWVGRNLDAKRT